MFILRALAFFFLTQAVLAQQPTPILPDPKLTLGDTMAFSVPIKISTPETRFPN